MTIQKLFSVRDNKLSSYSRLFPEQAEINAVRAISVAANDKATQIGQFPEDFDLYQVAEFDDVTGQVTPIEPPKFIIAAMGVLKLQQQIESVVKK